MHMRVKLQVTSNLAASVLNQTKYIKTSKITISTINSSQELLPTASESFNKSSINIETKKN